MIWKRWPLECLPQWKQRSKWSKEHVRIPKEGELVWVIDDTVKRTEYKLTRIIKIPTSDDDFLQSTRVKIAHGELNWPVVMLAPVLYDSVFENKKTVPEQSGL